MGYFQLANLGYQWEDSVAKMEEFVNKALTLDPDLAQGHALRGWLYWFKGNPKEIASHSRRALAIFPDEPMALQGLILALSIAGRASEATPFAERLIKIDPLDSMTCFVIGARRLYGGQYDHALEAFRRWFELYPDNYLTHYWYALTLAYCGRTESAILMLGQAQVPKGVIWGTFPLKYALEGDAEKVVQLYAGLSPDSKRRNLADGQSSYQIAVTFAFVKQRQAALDWLENAVNRGFLNYPLMAEKDPFLANIRGEERFQKLMERVKYEWEHFEV